MEQCLEELADTVRRCAQGDLIKQVRTLQAMADGANGFMSLSVPGRIV